MYLKKIKQKKHTLQLQQNYYEWVLKNKAVTPQLLQLTH